MAISRQSDSIWAVAAMGEGRQDRPHSETRDRAIAGSRAHGRSLGEKHAHDAWMYEHRDDHGRFAPTPEMHAERHHEEGKKARGAERDAFVEGYHTGFTSHSAKKEREGTKKESFQHQSISQNPYSRDISFDDGLDDIDRRYYTKEEKQDRFRYYLTHGTYEGWRPETALERADRTRRPGDELGQRGNTPITDRNPAAPELDSLTHYANDVHGIKLTDKQPFSSQSYARLLGQDPARKSRARGKLPKGSIASDPMETTDANGVKHTFWHQISTEFPVDNPKAGQPYEPPVVYQTEYPGKNMSQGVPPRLTVALHHFRDDAGLQRPMVSNHSLSDSVDSTSRLSDLNGMFHTNDQTRLLHQLGVQRIGDWDDEIKFRYKHPNGQIQYTIQRVNGDDSRYKTGKSGVYYDPELGSKSLMGEKHPDYIGEHWRVTPYTQERIYPFDPSRRNETRRVAHNPVDFPADDDHGFGQMVNHVLTGAGTDLAPDYSRMPQNQMDATPPERFNPKTGSQSPSIRPWVPQNNIHRSRERLGLPQF